MSGRFAKGTQGDLAVADLTALIKLPGLPKEMAAMCLMERARSAGQTGDSASAIADFKRLAGLSGAPATQVAQARKALQRLRSKPGPS